MFPSSSGARAWMYSDLSSFSTAMSERLRKATSVSGNSILVSRSVEMETEIGFPSHRITPA
jgi:hypothetical protein